MCVDLYSCWASWFRDRPRQKGAQKTATKSRMLQSTWKTISTHLYLRRVSKERYLFRANKDTHRHIQVGIAEPGPNFICVGRPTALFFYIVHCTHLKLTYVKTVPSLYIVGWSSFEISFSNDLEERNVGVLPWWIFILTSRKDGNSFLPQCIIQDCLRIELLM